MNDKPVKVLLIEDNPGDVRLIREMLTEVRSIPFELKYAERLSAGMERLGEGDIGIVLLDLGLPDSHGFDTLDKVQAQASDVPIVVLTGLADEALAVEAVKKGAQDYLVKGQVDSNLLVRSMRYAIERHHLLAELERTRREQEMNSLEQLSTPKTATTAQMLGLMPLHQSVPNLFSEMLQRYGDLMELALEQQAYRVEHDISGNLRTIAEELGSFKVGPRDVVELHSSALKRKTDVASHAKAQAYAEEGRMMVLQLMGHLASYYRTYSLGTTAVKMNDIPVKGGNSDE